MSERQVYVVELHPLFEMAFEAFPNFVIVDKNGRIFYLNKCYADLLGVEQLEAIGLPVSEVIPGTRMEEVIKAGKREMGSIMEMEDHRTHQKVTLVCNRIPLIKEDGKIVGAVAMTTFDELGDLNRLYEQYRKIETENKHYQETIERLEGQLNQPNPFGNIVGTSAALRNTKKTIEDFARSNLPILLMGETGVGKEVFASAVHELSSRRSNSFVKINCASIPRELLESELFGYEEGAFTGAKRHGKIGKFELANNGTILLDEIGEMSFDLQSKLLRVLQEKELERIGAEKPKKINVRIICSTNRDLYKLVQEGKFRSDLYYRINTVEVTIPPLRERMEDLPALCHYFIDKVNKENGIHTLGIEDEVIELFCTYDWPGNVRELQHTLERLSFLNQDSVITLKDCGFVEEKIAQEEHRRKSGRQAPDPEVYPSAELKEKREQMEKEAIIAALKQADGVKSKAAQILGINRSLLYYKIKKYEL